MQARQFTKGDVVGEEEAQAGVEKQGQSQHGHDSIDEAIANQVFLPQELATRWQWFKMQCQAAKV